MPNDPYLSLLRSSHTHQLYNAKSLLGFTGNIISQIMQYSGIIMTLSVPLSEYTLQCLVNIISDVSTGNSYMPNYREKHRSYLANRFGCRSLKKSSK